MRTDWPKEFLAKRRAIGILALAEALSKNNPQHPAAGQGQDDGNPEGSEEVEAAAPSWLVHSQDISGFDFDFDGPPAADGSGCFSEAGSSDRVSEAGSSDRVLEAGSCDHFLDAQSSGGNGSGSFWGEGTLENPRKSYSEGSEPNRGEGTGEGYSDCREGGEMVESTSGNDFSDYSDCSEAVSFSGSYTGKFRSQSSGESADVPGSGTGKGLDLGSGLVSREGSSLGAREGSGLGSREGSDRGEGSRRQGSVEGPEEGSDHGSDQESNQGSDQGTGQRLSQDLVGFEGEGGEASGGVRMVGVRVSGRSGSQGGAQGGSGGSPRGGAQGGGSQGSSFQSPSKGYRSKSSTHEVVGSALMLRTHSNELFDRTTIDVCTPRDARRNSVFDE